MTLETQPEKIADQSGLLPLAARRHRLVAEIDRRLRRKCGLWSCVTEQALRPSILVGVSGGADSTALLMACVVLRNRYRGRTSDSYQEFELAAAYVNHHLRSEAEVEADFVADLCQKHSVPFLLKHVHPNHMQGNLQANARSMRYQALTDAASETGADYVAVAHHGEDQLETLLIALCRGTSLAGLSGMAWSRSLTDKIKLLRPMLGVKKKDAEDFCTAAQINWRIDSSNDDQSQIRPRLRRDILPILEELWPDAARRVTHSREVIAEAEQLWQKRVEEIFGRDSDCSWDRKVLRGNPILLISSGLRRAALHHNPGIADTLGQRQLLEAAECIVDAGTEPKQFHWPGGLVLKITSKQVTLNFSEENDR